MSDHYSNSIDYHNDLDAFEARVRAEQEEAESAQDEKCPDCMGQGYMPNGTAANRRCDTCRGSGKKQQDEQCTRLEYPGDNADCPVHSPEGSDTSMSGQLNDSGFGSRAWFDAIEPIEF